MRKENEMMKLTRKSVFRYCVYLAVSCFIFQFLVLINDLDVNRSFSRLEADRMLDSSLIKTHSNVTFIQNLNSSADIENSFHITDNNPLKTVIASSQVKLCQNFTAYNEKFAFLENVIIDKEYSKGRKGGEKIGDVMRQKESDEFYTFKPGFFRMKCPKNNQKIIFSSRNNHLNKWFSALKTVDKIDEDALVENIFTIAITRYDYANIYFVMIDIYNAFIIMKLLNKSPAETSVLFIDGHPSGNIDPLWNLSFNKIDLIGYQQKPTLYKELVWGMLGYTSLILHNHNKNLPLVDEFHRFILDSVDAGPDKTLDCNKLSILFIWRRDYVAHPRNPSGVIKRKIKNEMELLQETKNHYPKWNIKGEQLDLYHIKEQIQIISKTDILIGMHGAGMAHAFNLPSHAAVIEFFPAYEPGKNNHMEMITGFRNLIYRKWVNRNQQNEFKNYLTHIPPEIAIDLIDVIYKKICSN